MELDSALNIPGEYEMRLLHQLSARDDRCCFNSNAIEVMDGLSRPGVLSDEELDEGFLNVCYPAEPAVKLGEIIKLERRTAELLHRTGKAEESYVKRFIRMLEDVAAGGEPAADPAGGGVTAVFAKKVISALFGRLSGCRAAAIHGSAARSETDEFSDVDFDLFFDEPPDPMEIETVLRRDGFGGTNLSVSDDDVSFAVNGIEFQGDVWKVHEIEAFLGRWPEHICDWPWDYLCEQFRDAVCVGGDEVWHENTRRVISSPPAKLKQQLLTTQLGAARGKLAAMSQGADTGDVAGFFRALNARFDGWTWHWVKCLMTTNDRFIDVPKALVQRSSELVLAPHNVSGKLSSLFCWDLACQGMKEIVVTCECLTEETNWSNLAAKHSDSVNNESPRSIDRR